MKNLRHEDWASIQTLFDELVEMNAADRTRQLEHSTLPANVIAATRELLDEASKEGILDGERPILQPAADPADHIPLGPGIEVGGFTIDRLIGRGGMGEVYLAHRTTIDFEQRVALKMLRAEAAERGGLFERERRMLARLEHSGIARLIDGGIAPDGRPYMAMEYVDGDPIDLWCRRTGADLTTRLRLFRETCDAVACAHASLVVHCDLKPSNVLIDRAGKVRLLDFGIARLLEDGDAAPAATGPILTPDYAAPEQIENEPSTVATDTYSLGVILFELMVGASPWPREGSSTPALIRRILSDDPPLPSQMANRPDAPVPSRKIAGDIDAIILKAMRRLRFSKTGSSPDSIHPRTSSARFRAVASVTLLALPRPISRRRPFFCTLHTQLLLPVVPMTRNRPSPSPRRPARVAALTRVADSFPIAKIFPHSFPQANSDTAESQRTDADANHHKRFENLSFQRHLRMR